MGHAPILELSDAAQPTRKSVPIATVNKVVAHDSRRALEILSIFADPITWHFRAGCRTVEGSPRRRRRRPGASRHRGGIARISENALVRSIARAAGRRST